MRTRIRIRLGAAAAAMIGVLGWTAPQHPPPNPSKTSVEAPPGRILWQYETGG